MSHPSKYRHQTSTLITMEIHNMHKVWGSIKEYNCVCEPRESGNNFPLNYKFNCKQNSLNEKIRKRTTVVEKSKLCFPKFLFICIFLEALETCHVTLYGTPRVKECGSPRGFRVTQRSLSSPIYTSFKYVRMDFGLIKNSNLWDRSTCWSQAWCERLVNIHCKGGDIIPFVYEWDCLILENLGLRIFFFTYVSLLSLYPSQPFALNWTT